eukprot:762972-Hanusia_phi.AAC.8
MHLIEKQGHNDSKSSELLTTNSSQFKTTESAAKSLISFEDMQRTLAFELWGIGEGSTRLLDILQTSNLSSSRREAESCDSRDVSVESSVRLEYMSAISRSDLTDNRRTQTSKDCLISSSAESEDAAEDGRMVEDMLQAQGCERDLQQEAFQAHVQRIAKGSKPRLTQTRVKASSGAGTKIIPDYQRSRATARSAHNLSRLHRSSSPALDADKENKRQVSAPSMLAPASRSPSRATKQVHKAGLRAKEADKSTRTRPSTARDRQGEQPQGSRRRSQSASIVKRKEVTGSVRPVRREVPTRKAKAENTSPWILMQHEEEDSDVQVETDAAEASAPDTPDPFPTIRSTSKKSIVERCEWLQQEWAILVLQASIRRIIARNAARLEQQRSGRAGRWASYRGSTKMEAKPAEGKISLGKEAKPWILHTSGDGSKRRGGRENIAVKRPRKHPNKAPALWIPFDLGARSSEKRRGFAEEQEQEQEQEQEALNSMYAGRSTLLDGSSLLAFLPLQSLEVSKEEELSSLRGAPSGFRVLMSRSSRRGNSAGGGVVRTCMRLRMMRWAFMSWCDGVWRDETGVGRLYR